MPPPPIGALTEHVQQVSHCSRLSFLGVNFCQASGFGKEMQYVLLQTSFKLSLMEENCPVYVAFGLVAL